MKDCTCAIKDPKTCPRHRHLYLGVPPPGTGVDLVPGYLESADGLADAADQRKADAR